MKAIKPETVNFCWRKLFPDVVSDFTGFKTVNQGNHERYCEYGKRGGGRGFEGFQHMDLGEIQEQIDTTPEELTEDNLMEMSALDYQCQTRRRRR